MRAISIAQAALTTTAAVLLAVTSASGFARDDVSPTALAGLRSVLSTEMALAGPQSGAYVLDLRTGRVLFNVRGSVQRTPASVEKLYTMTTALVQFGPTGRLVTDIYGDGHAGADGVWHGDLYLRGGGDPTFGDSAYNAQHYGGGATAQALASSLIAAQGITHVDGRILGDASFFDSLAGAPSSDDTLDLPDLGGSLSGLEFDRGAATQLRTPAALAAYAFAGALRARGVSVRGPSGIGRTPPLHSELLASVPSPSLRTIATMTLRPSDNFFAETILKALGATFGSAGTSAAGVADVKGFLSSLGLHPQIVDGSGLSRADRTSPEQVVRLLADLRPGGVANIQDAGTALFSSLAIVGRAGTLADRMTGTVAAGHCVAKTGTLDDVSSIAGVCNGRYAFAVIENATKIPGAHTREDAMTVAIAGLP